MLVAGDGIHTTFCECAPLRTKCLLILRTYVPHPWLLKAENPLEMVNEKRNTEQLFWPRQSIFLAPSPISCPKRWYKLYGDVDLRRDKKLGQQICLLFLLHIVPSVCRSGSSSLSLSSVFPTISPPNRERSSLSSLSFSQSQTSIPINRHHVLANSPLALRADFIVLFPSLFTEGNSNSNISLKDKLTTHKVSLGHTYTWHGV